RVSANSGANGDPNLLDAEDLIAAFSNGTDSDANGFVDDIAGWDFFDNDNDPFDASSYFAAHHHGSGRASNAAERGNDGQGGIGVPVGCPGTSLPTETYFRGANTTQYGGKSSISMEGTTGSENTGKAAGAAALVVSAARDASPSVALRPDETREILEQTAERV